MEHNTWFYSLHFEVQGKRLVITDEEANIIFKTDDVGDLRAAMGAIRLQVQDWVDEKKPWLVKEEL